MCKIWKLVGNLFIIIIIIIIIISIIIIIMQCPQWLQFFNFDTFIVLQ